jgi:hypothetical protein
MSDSSKFKVIIDGDINETGQLMPTNLNINGENMEVSIDNAKDLKTFLTNDPQKSIINNAINNFNSKPIISNELSSLNPDAPINDNSSLRNKVKVIRNKIISGFNNNKEIKFVDLIPFIKNKLTDPSITGGKFTGLQTMLKDIENYNSKDIDNMKLLDEEHQIESVITIVGDTDLQKGNDLLSKLKNNLNDNTISIKELIRMMDDSIRVTKLEMAAPNYDNNSKSLDTKSIEKLNEYKRLLNILSSNGVKGGARKTHKRSNIQSKKGGARKTSKKSGNKKSQKINK